MAKIHVTVSRSLSIHGDVMPSVYVCSQQNIETRQTLPRQVITGLYSLSRYNSEVCPYLPWEGVSAAWRAVAWRGCFRRRGAKKPQRGVKASCPSSSCDSRALLGDEWRPACHPPTLNEYLLESSRSRLRRWNAAFFCGREDESHSGNIWCQATSSWFVDKK